MTLRKLNWVGLLALAAAAAGCGGPGGPIVRVSPCEAVVDDVAGTFKPLPAGLRYEPVPAEMMASAREQVGDKFLAFEARHIYSGGVQTGGVITEVLITPAENAHDEEQMARAVAGPLGTDATVERVRVGSQAVTRVDALAGGAAYVAVYSHCRVVGVFGTDDERARRAARAVFR